MKRHTKQDVRRAIEAKSGGIRKTAKEENLRIYVDGKRIGRVTVPKGRGALHPRTAGKIRDQLKLTADDFSDFVRCPMTGADYEQLLRDKVGAGLI
jgi:hypothetical protein